MKLVTQIVSDAELSVDGKIISKIGYGLVAYFCVEKGDEEEKLQFFAKKIAEMRIFPDDNGKTNLSIKDVNGEVLLISQFTLAGDYLSSRRPFFGNAENPERAENLYLKLKSILEKDYGLNVKLGVFGADMTVKQTGRGPFTVYLER
ncbi:MAG: D-tyrosyl-tRNA(Tyr) deacylase [Clostridia bacterium]|nr:D-tyrosyl-tRNA(Tyr) deacylase [Clostridia bacterium]